MFFNTLRPRQNGRRFADDTFRRIILNENVTIPIEISLKFVPKVRINNIPALVQMMAWRPPGNKPLSAPMMDSLLTHICVTRAQWVKYRKIHIYLITDGVYPSYILTYTPHFSSSSWIVVLSFISHRMLTACHWMRQIFQMFSICDKFYWRNGMVTFMAGKCKRMLGCSLFMSIIVHINAALVYCRDILTYCFFVWCRLAQLLCVCCSVWCDWFQKIDLGIFTGLHH